MGKPQAESGGVGGPTELAGGAAATAADFQPRCPRNVAQNDTRLRPATTRGLAPDLAIGRIAGSTERRDRTTTVALQTSAQARQARSRVAIRLGVRRCGLRREPAFSHVSTRLISSGASEH